MAGVKLSADAKAKLKLLVPFFGGYYPNDEIGRDMVIDWAIADYQPLDWQVVWNGKNYALECRVCGFVGVRASTALRHLRKGCEATDSTLDIAARPVEINGRGGAVSVYGPVSAPDESTLDIDEGAERRPRLTPGELVPVSHAEEDPSGNG